MHRYLSIGQQVLSRVASSSYLVMYCVSITLRIFLATLESQIDPSLQDYAIHQSVYQSRLRLQSNLSASAREQSITVSIAAMALSFNLMRPLS